MRRNARMNTRTRRLVYNLTRCRLRAETISVCVNNRIQRKGAAGPKEKGAAAQMKGAPAKRKALHVKRKARPVKGKARQAEGKGAAGAPFFGIFIYYICGTYFVRSGGGAIIYSLCARGGLFLESCFCKKESSASENMHNATSVRYCPKTTTPSSSSPRPHPHRLHIV